MFWDLLFFEKPIFVSDSSVNKSESNWNRCFPIKLLFSSLISLSNVLKIGLICRKV